MNALIAPRRSLKAMRSSAKTGRSIAASDAPRRARRSRSKSGERRWGVGSGEWGAGSGELKVYFEGGTPCSPFLGDFTWNLTPYNTRLRLKVYNHNQF